MSNQNNKLDNIYLMRLFNAIVRGGSFAAAAEALEISTSKASKDIQFLEQQLGTSLLKRTTRRLQVTDSGNDFHRRAEQIIALHQQMLDSLDKQKRCVSGELRLTAPKLWGEEVLTPAIIAFKQAYPEVILVADYSDCRRDLILGNIHIGFRSAEAAPEDYIARPICEDASVLCASAAYLSSREAPQHIQQLRQHSCITYGNQLSSLETWEFGEGRELIRCDIQGQLCFNSKRAALTAVRQGLGIAKMPAYMVADDLSQGRLVQVLPQQPLKSSRFYALYTQRREESALVNQFIGFVCDYLARQQQSLNAD
ncbi:LysR family transcriptional regulator [Shewanella cyperi]|uniref:LysR family transcriptional regulator n=1 Tax=Shewanella cyperi TaxID=2814292 RepID=UPI001A95156A|nr:LysR family transcriptional regulator [Shewanella cyperi]QSX41823.1 LysR family transcriptional regulator [Shewanella cyperi]